MIAAHKGAIPFAVLILPFIAGIACGLFLFSGAGIAFLWVVFFAFALTFIILNLLYKRFNLYRYRWVGGLLIYAVLFTGGLVSIANYNELSKPDHFSKTHADYLLVKISNEPKANNGNIRFTADVQQLVTGNKSSSASGNLMIAIKDSAANTLCYGDALLIPALWRPVDPPSNPAEFNYKKYLAGQNIHYQEYLRAGQYFVFKQNAGNPFIAYSLKLRQGLIEKFRANMDSPEAIAVASTLILGYKADLSNDVLQAYSKTGTVHVLSVSGAHVAILFILLEFLFGFLNGFRHGKTVSAVLIIAIIWYYSMLTGFSPAVCRAAFMISMVIIGRTYARNINTLNVMAVSAFFLLLYDPLFITDVGFQLSYLAVAGLIIFQPIVYKWFEFKHKWADKLWALCSVSIAAQVVTFPLSAYYFHQFPVYFLVSNLFIIIPVAAIMYSGFAYMILASVPFLGKALGFALEKSILLMDQGLSRIEQAPFSGIYKIWLTPLEYILLYFVIIAIFYFLYNKKAASLKLTIVTLLVFSFSISLKRWHHMRTNEITFLDLRKHTGIIFRKGNDAVVLTDLRDTDKIYRYSVQPYLDSCQVSNTMLCPPDSDIKVGYIQKKGSLVSFDGKTILIFNRKLQGIALPEKLKPDYLYVSGNPTAALSSINKNFNYKLIVIDGTNSNSLTDRLQNQAISAHTDYMILRRNKSVTVPSN